MDTRAGDPDFYGRLLTISQEAFAGGLYPVAYHALMGALHCADRTHDRGRLREVLTLATVQRQALATHTPDERLSPQSAARRGNQHIYDALALEGQAMLVRARSAQVLGE